MRVFISFNIENAKHLLSTFEEIDLCEYVGKMFGSNEEEDVTIEDYEVDE